MESFVALVRGYYGANVKKTICVVDNDGGPLVRAVARPYSIRPQREPRWTGEIRSGGEQIYVVAAAAALPTQRLPEFRRISQL